MHLEGEAVTFHDFFKNYEKSARLIVYFSMLCYYWLGGRKGIQLVENHFAQCT